VGNPPKLVLSKAVRLPPSGTLRSKPDLHKTLTRNPLNKQPDLYRPGFIVWVGQVFRLSNMAYVRLKA